MKKVAVLLVVWAICWCVAYAQKVRTNVPNVRSSYTQQQSFSGKWIWSSKSADFNLTLKQKGNSISGIYDAVAANGSHIDEGGDGEPENKVTGTIVNGVAMVRFVSSSWGGSGKATINLLSGGKLEWTIIAQSGQHWAPPKAILVRGK